jgi:PAS domain S-box-containing protein
MAYRPRSPRPGSSAAIPMPPNPPRVTAAARPTVETDELYRLLVASVRDYAIFALDPAGYIVTWNPGAERFKGYRAEEIIGRHFSVFYPAADIAAGKPVDELVVAEREGRFEDEGWRLRKDGSRFWANVVITALYDDQRRLAGFAKITRDLTARREAEQRAIEDAQRVAAAEASSRAKSTFLAALSHELRTPLNAIGGYLDLIAAGVRGPVTSDQCLDLERMRRSHHYLLSVINDLLDFSRIEAGKLAYDIRHIPVTAIVDSVASMMTPNAASRGLTFRRIPSPANTMVLADQVKAEQVVFNLLANAMKFTPSGGTVVLSCTCLDQLVSVTVRDTGPGIAAEKLEAIFEPFVQLGRSLTSGSEGIGLGLSISRTLARGMGGDVTVVSALGAGSTFTLSLPATA